MAVGEGREGTRGPVTHTKRGTEAESLSSLQMQSYKQSGSTPLSKATDTVLTWTLLKALCASIRKANWAWHRLRSSSVIQ